MMRNNHLKKALSRRLTNFLTPNMLSAAFSSEVVPKVKNFINGQFVDSKTTEWIPLQNPATQEIVCMVPKSTIEELREAELGACEAFKLWKEVPIQQKQRVFFKLQHLIREYTEELAVSITTEQGKTLQDARGDVFRGLEVVESACSMGHLTMGESAENLSRGLDTYTYRQPLGKIMTIFLFIHMNIAYQIYGYAYVLLSVCMSVCICKYTYYQYRYYCLLLSELSQLLLLVSLSLFPLLLFLLSSLLLNFYHFYYNSDSYSYQYSYYY